MSKREFPARIYLQRNNDDRMGGPEVIEDTTWCADKINDEDVEYVRLDLHKAALARAKPPAEPPCAHENTRGWGDTTGCGESWCMRCGKKLKDQPRLAPTVNPQA